MSFTNITPIVNTHLLYAQAGRDVLVKNAADAAGHAGGTAGTGPTAYKEYLAGNECGSYTSADNTAGVLFFPEIKYWTALHNLSVVGADLLSLETMAKSITGDHLSKTADYDPEAVTSEFFHIYHGDEIFGKFNRICVYKTGASGQKGRLLLTRGPSNS